MAERVAGNVVWNWAGMAVNMLAGFVVAPFLVHRLGDSSYGLWILIASMTGYFGLLDLGVRASVGRYVAYCRARGEQDGVNAIVSTAVAITTGVGLLALVATVSLVPVFHHLFQIAPGDLVSVNWAIVLVGLTLALTFPLSVFDGVLWGCERFDLLNAIDIPTVVLRMVLTFLLVDGPADIAALAWLTLGTTVANEIAKMMAAFAVNRGLVVARRCVQKAAAVKLYGYGIWQFLLSISRQINGQIGPLVIGALLSVAVVTPFSIASRLIAYASSFLVAATGVFTPVATGMCARQDSARQRELFLVGGQCCTVMATYLTLLMILLGDGFLRLWMGDRLAGGTVMLLIALAVGEWLPMSQWLTNGIILAMARHRPMAIANLLEGLVAVLGMLLVVRPWGLTGVCVAFAVAALLCRGVFQLVYGCRLVGVELRQYVAVVLGKSLAVSVAPAALLGAAVWVYPPETWLALFAYGVAFSVVFGASSVWLLGLRSYLPLPRHRAPRALAMEHVQS